MADLVIHDELARRLLEKARRENQTVEEMLESFLIEDMSKEDHGPTPGTFAALAKAAEKAGIGRDSGPTDTSERSREILNAEYAEYLKRRMDE